MRDALGYRRKVCIWVRGSMMYDLVMYDVPLVRRRLYLRRTILSLVATPKSTNDNAD